MVPYGFPLADNNNQNDSGDEQQNIRGSCSNALAINRVFITYKVIQLQFCDTIKCSLIYPVPTGPIFSLQSVEIVTFIMYLPSGTPLKDAIVSQLYTYSSIKCQKRGTVQAEEKHLASGKCIKHIDFNVFAESSCSINS